MFGFIRPIKSELRVREVERFRNIYCGLCRLIKHQFGRLHTYFLSYDMTFMALVLCCLEENNPGLERHRCDANPIIPHDMACASPGLIRSSQISVLLNYHKLCDTFRDEHGMKHVVARVALQGVSSSYRKVRAALPEVDQAMQRCLKELSELEADSVPSLDQPADTFARLLTSAVPSTGDSSERILCQMFYHIGRWVYLIDACVDLESDWKSGAYNPIALRFGLTVPSLEPIKQELESTLQRSLADIYNAFELLTVYRDRELIENIICLGLPTVTRQVLDGTYQSNGGQNRHGSL